MLRQETSDVIKDKDGESVSGSSSGRGAVTQALITSVMLSKPTTT